MRNFNMQVTSEGHVEYEKASEAWPCSGATGLASLAQKIRLHVGSKALGHKWKKAFN